MTGRAFAPILLLLPLFAGGCEDDTEVLMVDLTVNAYRQTEREVEIEVSVRNRGTIPVRYMSCPGPCSDLSIRIASEDGAEFLLCHSCVPILAPCETQALLAPGDRISGRFLFRGSAWKPDVQDLSCRPDCLPFGRYSAVFRFTYSVENGAWDTVEENVGFDWPAEPVDLPPNGLWGGTGIELMLASCGGPFALDCGEGYLSEPLILNGEGRFEGAGVLAYGPVFRVLRPMTYEGSVDDGTLMLTIHESPEASFGPYLLAFGEKGVLRPCQ